MPHVFSLRSVFPATLAVLCLAGCEQVPQKNARSGTRVDGPLGPTPLPVAEAINSEPVYLTGDAPIFSTKLVLNGVRSGYAVMRFTVTKEGRAVRPKAVEWPT